MARIPSKDFWSLYRMKSKEEFSVIRLETFTILDLFTTNLN